MAQFKFRAATLLRMREARRDERRGQLAEALRAEQLVVARIAELDAELEALRLRCRDAARLGGVVDVDLLTDASRYEMILKLQSQSADQQRQAVLAEIERRRAALVVADRDVRELEKLRETQHERFQQEENRREIKRLDELAVTRPRARGDALMGRLFGTLGAVLVYVCLGTVLAQAIVLGYAWMHGSLDKEKVDRLTDVLRGIEIAPPPVEKESAKSAELPEQPSLTELERSRDIKDRRLELREQAIQDSVERIRFEQRKLSDERDRYEFLKNSFEKLLDEKKNSLVTAGREHMRQLWENIKPKQAKDEILRMIDAGDQNEVVAIMSGIAIPKQAKIVAEFKTEDEQKKLDVLLQLMRQGVPDVQPLNQAREDMKKFNPKQPATTSAP